MESSKKEIPCDLTNEEIDALVTIAGSLGKTVDELLEQILDC